MEEEVEEKELPRRKMPGSDSLIKLCRGMRAVSSMISKLSTEYSSRSEDRKESMMVLLGELWIMETTRRQASMGADPGTDGETGGWRLHERPTGSRVRDYAFPCVPRQYGNDGTTST
jgi:hypothetical protein